jgi:hypothetical protein
MFDPGQYGPEAGEMVGLLRINSPQVINAIKGSTGRMGFSVLGMTPANHLEGSNTTREKISTHVLYIKPIIG